MIKARNGFTLVEMAVVLVLMSLIGIAIIPSMELVYKQELNKAAQAICLDLTTLRKQSIATGKTYTLTMNSDQRSYSMDGEGGVRAALRSGNNENSKNIKYTKEDDTAITKISFKGNTMKVNDAELEEFKIKVKYNGSGFYIEIVWDSSGHYTITTKQ